MTCSKQSSALGRDAGLALSEDACGPAFHTASVPAPLGSILYLLETINGVLPFLTRCPAT